MAKGIFQRRMGITIRDMVVLGISITSIEWGDFTVRISEKAMSVTDDEDIAVVDLTPEARDAIIRALGGYTGEEMTHG